MGGGDLMTNLGGLLPFILIFVIMYFLILRPQQKRAKQHQEMVKNLRRGDNVIVRIAGLGFLHRMVRITVGTLIEIATGRRAVDDIPAILASRDRRRAGYTAPAIGLTLVGVRYPGFDSERYPSSS